VRKAYIIVAAIILGIPIFGLLVSAGIGAKLAVADQRHLHTCDPEDALSFAGTQSLDRAEILCYQQAANSVLWRASASLLVVTLLIPVSFGGLAFALGRRRQWLARYFPWIVRPTMIGVAFLLVLHGLLILYTGLQLSVAVNYFGFFIWASIIGLGFAGTGILIVFEAVRRRQADAIRATGLVVDSERLPELTARVARVAENLNVGVPARVVVGLEVVAFVTRIPISLRGSGLLAPGETLYLPACALHILEEKQLEALLGHELAHFRGEDVAFTERFIPSFLALQNAIESVSPDTSRSVSNSTSGWGLLAKLPALLLMQLIAVVTAVAVARIRRARELEADRVGAELASPEAFARALVKFSLLMVPWKPFRAANARYLRSGRARSNLCADFLQCSRGLLAMADRDSLRQTVLSSRLTHPTDTHPTLAERIRALGLDPAVILDESLADLSRTTEVSSELTELEAAITSIENDWMSTPGTPVITDTEETLPDALRLRLRNSVERVQ